MDLNHSLEAPMAALTYTLQTLADANVVLTEQGRTPTGSIFKDTLRGLSVPQTLKLDFKVGAPGALGNDKILLTLSNSVANSAGNSPTVVTGSLKMEVSIPRASVWTATFTNDLMAELVSFLTDGRIANLTDALTPAA